MSVFGDDELFEEFDLGKGNTGNDSGATDDEDSDESDKESTSERCKELIRENEELKRKLRLLQRPPNVKVRDSRKDGPIAHVVLFNNTISRKYKEEIQEFLHELGNKKVKNFSEVPEDIQPTFIQYSSPKKEDTKRKKSSKRFLACTKAFQGFMSIQVYDKFFIDQLGEPVYFQDPNFSEWVIPEYESVEFSPLAGELFGLKQNKPKKIQRICFNCGGSDHQIKDCEKERDQRGINERRQKFMNEVAKYSQGSPQIRIDGSRYHKEDDAEVDKERFAKFEPGVISAELQEALGIQEDDIPPYVYQMRRLGYPPGHLYNARIVNSGITLYEEGEINGRVEEGEYVPIQIEKLIGFPGYNMPPLPGQRDKYKDNYVKPIDHSQSKEVMVSYYQHRNALYYNQKAVSDNRNSENSKAKKPHDADIDEVDMDMGEDETNDAVKEVDTEAGEIEDNSSTMMEIEADVGDLSQDELEIKRELLLRELKNAAENNQDSDYRSIKSGDQDYRIPSSDMIIATEESPESPPPEPPLTKQSANADTDLRTSVIDLDSDNAPTYKMDSVVDIKERSLSNDTDYRVPVPVIEITSSPELTEKIAEDLQTLPTEQPASSTTDGNGSGGLPSRHKFAEGISQFDMYYAESKQQGVYNKLRSLLKDSPRRQEK